MRLSHFLESYPGEKWIYSSSCVDLFLFVHHVIFLASSLKALQTYKDNSMPPHYFVVLGH